MPIRDLTFDDLIDEEKKNPKKVTAKDLTFNDLISEARSSAPTERDAYLSNPFVRLAKGMKDPIDAGAQWLSRGAEMIPGVMPAAQWVSEKLGMPDPTARGVDSSIAESEKEYQRARLATTPETFSSMVTGRKDPGFDLMRAAGNVLSPVNVVTARAAGIPKTLAAKDLAISGAKAGAAGGALTTVTDEKAQKDFAKSKAVDIVSGTAMGAALSPVVAKGVEKAATFLQGLRKPAISIEDVDAAIESVMRDAGVDFSRIPNDMRRQLRAEVGKAIMGGSKLDPAAAARRADFEALNIKPTLGQITRDPQQFAKEINLRGVDGIGDPLLARFTEQNRALQDLILKYGAGSAAGDSDVGRNIASGLAKRDSILDAEANNYYDAFRRLMPDAPSQDPVRFSNFTIKALEDSGVDYAVPQSFMQRLNDITSGNFPVTSATLEKLRKTAQAFTQSSDGNLRKAGGIIKGQIDEEMQRVAEAAGPKGELAAEAIKRGRELVRTRYGLQEELPGMKASVTGSIDPQDFVQKFVINGDTRDVAKMMKILKFESPDAVVQVRSKIGEHLQRQAFGENLGGDKQFSPERFAKAVRDLGPEKLSVFYNRTEIEALNRIARVAAYIGSSPGRAPVNWSNNSAWALTALSKIPGLGGVASEILRAISKPLEQRAALRAALAAKVPQTPAELPSDLERYIRQSATSAGVGTGILSGRAF